MNDDGNTPVPGETPYPVGQTGTQLPGSTPVPGEPMGTNNRDAVPGETMRVIQGGDIRYQDEGAIFLEDS